MGSPARLDAPSFCPSSRAVFPDTWNTGVPFVLTVTLVWRLASQCLSLCPAGQDPLLGTWMDYNGLVFGPRLCSSPLAEEKARTRALCCVLFEMSLSLSLSLQLSILWDQSWTKPVSPGL